MEDYLVNETRFPPKEGFYPRVFRSRVDGSVVVQRGFSPDPWYGFVYQGKRAIALIPPSVWLTEEFVRDNQLLDFEELTPHVATPSTETPES